MGIPGSEEPATPRFSLLHLPRLSPHLLPLPTAGMCPGVLPPPSSHLCLASWPHSGPTSFSCLVHLRSVAQLCLTLCDPMDCSTPGFPVHHQLPELAQTHVHQVSDAIQPSHPLSSPSPLSFNLSSIRVFSKESVLCIRWPKYWSFSFSISPSNKYSGLISFRIDWFDLLAIQGTLKSLLQHHNSKASIIRHPAFFIVQLSHPYTTTGKTIALTRRTFFGEVMCLLFITLSRFVLAFLPKHKRLLILWLQSLSTVIMEPKKINSGTVFIFPYLFAVK